MIVLLSFIFSFLFMLAFVDIILIFILCAAQNGVGAATQKHLLAILAQAQGLVTVHQYEAEHHLDTQQQGMEIPIDGGPVQQFDVVTAADPQ